MHRREFLCVLCGAAASPVVAHAQQGERILQIGVLMPSNANDPESQIRATAFAKALKEFGWEDGHNVRIHYRWPGPDHEQTRAATAELLGLPADLILACNTPALAAARAQTQTLPIIFLNVTDPVGQGFIESLAHPGGNVTGFTSFEFSMGGKWIAILKEVAPNVDRIGLIFNPVTAPYVRFYIKAFQAAAPRFAVTLLPIPIHNAVEIERGIGGFASTPNGGLFVAPDITTAVNRDLIIRLTVKHSLPAVFPYRFFVNSGGLLSYGVDITDLFRRAAGYVDRIFRGTNPGTLPVQQPVKFELVINLKTAKTLGLTIPQTLLAQADDVIE